MIRFFSSWLNYIIINWTVNYWCVELYRKHIIDRHAVSFWVITEMCVQRCKAPDQWLLILRLNSVSLKIINIGDPLPLSTLIHLA